VAVVDKLRQFEILLENTKMVTEQTRYLIKHAKQNQIDLGSENENESFFGDEDMSYSLSMGNITISD
jgi:hypothetical protein